VAHVALFALALATTLGVIGACTQLIVGGLRIRPLTEQAGEPNGPKVSVIVAARDEGPHIERALQSLLAQQYASFEIVAIDDRSADDTGAILDRMALEHPRLRVIHVTELPPHWLGKNHALHAGGEIATGEYLLFTDADVVFAPDALARGVAFARARGADHLTVGPEIESPSLLLTLVVTFFTLGFMGYYRPWHAEDPKRQEHIGIGAFNLVRTSLYREFGGHSKIALRPDDDIKLGRLVKLAGGRQLVAGGVGLVRVRWYSTVGELARGLRKNTFAGLHYNLPLAIAAVVAQLAVNVWPFVALFVTSGAVWWLNAISALILMTMYALVAHGVRSKLWLALGYPIAALIFVYIVIAAVWYTVSRRGIEWRGTFYSLDELKRNTV
jgi:glycosyltransferase involved in cell wall biosynthesis